MQATTVRAAVAGATGYIGIQCVELLAGHPGVETVRLLARRSVGRRFADVVPGSQVELELEPGLDPGDVDVVMACLPHGVAAAQAAGWLKRGVVVIDLSADFRMRDVADHERWYGAGHAAPDLCPKAVYGLPELLERDLTESNLFAMPGCYPTAALLAVAPALRAGLVTREVVVDAKSGVSGAGRSPGLGSHYAEVNESTTAYAVGGHRHLAELNQELRQAAGAEVRLTFVPHLVPMTRGILVTAYLQLGRAATADAVRGVYRSLCAAHPFLRYSETPPATKSVTHSNTATLHVADQGETVVVCCAIDNLLKGGAGQAVQVLNLRFGFAETAGLPQGGLWP
ncbi:MAG: N-acetyl-gamma-glutamyl-phosphate reductase [Candidatus Dormibacteria bacterium]